MYCKLLSYDTPTYFQKIFGPVVTRSNVEEVVPLPSVHDPPHFIARQCNCSADYADCYLPSAFENARDGILGTDLLDTEANYCY